MNEKNEKITIVIARNADNLFRVHIRRSSAPGRSYVKNLRNQGKHVVDAYTIKKKKV